MDIKTEYLFTTGEYMSVEYSGEVLRIDGYELKENEEWRTNENGEHYVINTKTGDVVTGMGGKIKNVGKSKQSATKHKDVSKEFNDILIMTNKYLDGKAKALDNLVDGSKVEIYSNDNHKKPYAEYIKEGDKWRLHALCEDLKPFDNETYDSETVAGKMHSEHRTQGGFSHGMKLLGGLIPDNYKVIGKFNEDDYHFLTRERDVKEANGYPTDIPTEDLLAPSYTFEPMKLYDRPKVKDGPYINPMLPQHFKPLAEKWDKAYRDMTKGDRTKVNVEGKTTEELYEIFKKNPERFLNSIGVIKIAVSPDKYNALGGMSYNTKIFSGDKYLQIGDNKYPIRAIARRHSEGDSFDVIQQIVEENGIAKKEEADFDLKEFFDNL